MIMMIMIMIIIIIIISIEVQRMWNPKCTIIPVIIGATGIVTRSLRKKDTVSALW
jgi:hypothetical protein